MKDSRKGIMVNDEFIAKRPNGTEYAMLPNDLLTWSEGDGFWWKECPGLALGICLTPRQVTEYTRPVEFISRGLEFMVLT